jgi:GT2 family glycosyltransferase/ubiquinone/menaquinone biosynthesis C-methylase UbiE
MPNGGLTMISIVIATFNKLEYTKQCIESIREYTSQGSYEIIIVDNFSTDETRIWLMEQEDLKVILNDQNCGFPKACNQGLEIANGEYVLLLNNDTVVTSGWLSNLEAALQSSPDIGAVSLLTNSSSYGQAIQTNYTTIEEMHVFSKSFNMSNQQLWEERAKLIGFCMLIKKSVLDQVGGLDERFTPGNFEDDDLSLRIRLAGYRLLLCRDTFIHHYGSVSFAEVPQSYLNLMRGNQKKFEEKWGVSLEQSCGIEVELANLIDAPPDKKLRVLHIGCGLGATLLAIKRLFPNALLYGYDDNSLAIRLLQKSSSLEYCMFENAHADMLNERFDYILVSNPSLINLNILNDIVSNQGKVIVQYPHLLGYQMMWQLLQGTYNSQQMESETYKGVEEIYSKMDFERISIKTVPYPHIGPDDMNFIRKLQELSGRNLEHLQIKNLIVIASKMNELAEIRDNLNMLIQSIDVNYHVNKLIAYDDDIVIELVRSTSEDAVALLNFLAIQFLNVRLVEKSIHYLETALKLPGEHSTTLFNLAVANMTNNDYNAALKWLVQIPIKNNQIYEWIEQIEKELALMGNSNDLEIILTQIDENNYSKNDIEIILEKNEVDEILGVISKEQIKNKSHVLNVLAVIGFEMEKYDKLIPLLQKSLEYSPQHKDSLMNLSVILERAGEVELAIQYALQIENKTDDVINWLNDLGFFGELEKDDVFLPEQNDVQFTGERLVINQFVKENFNNVLEEHLERYKFACKFAEGKDILDAACGAGYGTMMLQQAGAKNINGVDISEESIDNAKKTYNDKNILFEYGDVTSLLYDDESFDLVVSFETIEHIPNGTAWISESARLLREDGLFLVSTPNRAVTNPGTFFVERPLNPHHQYEYNIVEFIGELSEKYDIVGLYGQTFIDDFDTMSSKVMRQVRTLDLNFRPNHGMQFKSHELVPLSNVKDAQPMYVVAVCRKK